MAEIIKGTTVPYQIVGKLTVTAWTRLPDATDYDLQEVRDIMKRRLPEIHTKILKELNM